MLKVKGAIERSTVLWGIMLAKSSSTSLFIVILNFIIKLSLFMQDFPQNRRYVHVTQQMNWSKAQEYCREYHIDLAIFTTKDEFQILENPCKNPCWIALKRDRNYATIWKWSGREETSYSEWNNIRHLTTEGESGNCVATGQEYWFDLKCDEQKEFLCYDEPILVKKNKTWEEALEHCRNLNTPSNQLYDLMNIDIGGNNSNAREVILADQTQEVWIGLRFLAGHWVWVNGAPLLEQLPVCPAPSMHCGTMSKTGQILQLRNCLERRPFVCTIRN